MGVQGEIAVIGAGVIGAAVACALAREGHRVLLLDRDEPGLAGASFGNVGHIATELIEPLPSPQLLFGFWRELFFLRGQLDIRPGRLRHFAPWALRFASAAFRREANTRHLAPLVRPAAALHQKWLSEVGRPELLRSNGHYEIWLDPNGTTRAGAHGKAMERLGIPAQPASADLLDAIKSAARSRQAAGLWFPASGHVLDPLEVVRAFAGKALHLGARFEKTEVRALRPLGTATEVVTSNATFVPRAVVVCGGAWSAPLLAPFGLHAPLEAASGYNVELPNHAALVDAPILYANEKLLVTPMSGRLRCSSYMEFSGLDAPQDPRKVARLRDRVRKLGYDCPAGGPSWKGPRPVLPDYLPGIGRAPGGSTLFYAVGHQHLGLTMAPITGEIVADLVAQRPPRIDVRPFDLGRFGHPSRKQTR